MAIKHRQTLFDSYLVERPLVVAGVVAAAAVAAARVAVARPVHPVEEHVEQEGGGDSQTHQYVSRQVQGDVVRSARLAQLDDRKMQQKKHYTQCCC